METVWKNKNTCLFKNANAFLSHGIKEHNSKIWLYAAILLVCLKSNYTLKLLMILTLYSTDEIFKNLVICSGIHHQYVGALFNRTNRPSCKNMLRKKEDKNFHGIQLNLDTFRRKKKYQSFFGTVTDLFPYQFGSQNE